MRLIAKKQEDTSLLKIPISVLATNILVLSNLILVDLEIDL